MATYWEKRALEIEAEAYLKSEEAYRFVSKEYRRAMGEMERRLLVYLQRIADRHGLSLAKAQQMLTRGELEQFRMGLEEYIKAGEGELTPEIIRKMEDASDLHHLTRMQAMGLEMDQVVSRMTARYSATARELMETGYLDGFYKMSFEIGVMNGFRTVQKVDEAGLATILRRPWTADGVEFSERIWKNKEKLLNDLQRELWHATARGGEVESVVPRLAQRMKVSDSAARRLLHTEMTYFSTQGTLNAMEASGVVEKYEFVATLDSHTSDVCRDMDGKVFKLSEKQVGLNSPPLHCHCRSVVVPYFGDDIEDEFDETRMARDPETGESERVEGNLTYQEWREKYVEKSSEKGYNKTVSSGAKHYVRDTTDDFLKSPKEIQNETFAYVQYETIKNSDQKLEKEKIFRNIQRFPEMRDFTRADLDIAFDHVFNDLHELEKGTSLFDPDYDMAHSWRRLISGENIQKHDLILLRHERLERDIMHKEGLAYLPAHNKASETYLYKAPAE